MRKILSAGGIVARTVGEEQQVLLLTYPGSDMLRLAKGHVEQGEAIEEAALRETREETGAQDLKIVRKIGVVVRESLEDSGETVIKDIHMFLMRVTKFGNSTSGETSEWFTFSEAENKMFFPEEGEFLRKYRQSIYE